MLNLASLAPAETASEGLDRAPVASSTRLSPGPLLAGCAVVAVLAWSYRPIFEWLARAWMRDPDYSHGFLVPIFACVLIWLRRGLWPSESRGTTASLAVGMTLILAAGLMRSAGLYGQVITLEALSLLPLAAGVALCCGGWSAVRVVWPAVAFLIFMIPLPSGIAGLLSGQLQRIATVSSTYVLQLFGLPAVSEGNIIWLSESQIGVAEACSGLRMLMSITALAIGACLIIRRPLWEKLVLVASVPVVAIGANIARVAATGAAYEFGSAELADKIFHDLAGWLMMPLGLGMLFAEMAILSRVFLPEAQKLTLTVQTGGTASKPEQAKRPVPRQRPVQTVQSERLEQRTPQRKREHLDRRQRAR